MQFFCCCCCSPSASFRHEQAINVYSLFILSPLVKLNGRPVGLIFVYYWNDLANVFVFTFHVEKENEQMHTDDDTQRLIPMIRNISSINPDSIIQINDHYTSKRLRLFNIQLLHRTMRSKWCACACVYFVHVLWIRFFCFLFHKSISFVSSQMVSMLNRRVIVSVIGDIEMPTPFRWNRVIKR